MSTTDIAQVGIELAGKAVLPWTTDHHQLDSRTSLLGFFEGNNDDASDYLIYACNNFEALAKRVIELEAEHKLLLAVHDEAVKLPFHHMTTALFAALTAWRER